MNSMLEIIGREALDGNGASFEEAMFLTTNQTPLDEILYWTNAVREKHFSNKISLCSIVNARSGKCSENCSFCAQSAHHKTDTEVYQLLKKDEIISRAKAAKENGSHCFGIVTSGETVQGAELDEVAEAVKIIINELDLKCSASLGRLESKDFLKLKKAGLSLYHHNLETSENFFPNVCTTHTWSERYQTIKCALAAGLEVCCGGIMGLGENFEDRVNLAIACKNLGIKSVPLNFLNAIPGTPLADTPKLSPLEILRTIAIFRLCLPDSHIRICGGRETNLRELQSHIFRAGADGMMIGNYLTVKGRNMEDDLQMLKDLGMEW